MKTFTLFVFIYMLSSLGAQAQISLVGSSSNTITGSIDIMKWQALDSASVITYSTPLRGCYLGSSVFDAYNSNYYLTGYTSASSELLSFNTLTNDAVLSPYYTFSNITEIDMSTGKIYNLISDSIGYFSVNEYDINTGRDSLLGVISEPGIQGIRIDATGFDSNHGILYYVGFDNSQSDCLYAIPVRNTAFSWTKTTLLTTAPGNNFYSVNYDNVNDILFASNAEYDSANNYTVNRVVEINYLTGALISRGLLTGFPYFLVGSSSFDQNSGSLLLVGFDTNFMRRMIVFNTYTNTFETGFVPGNVSEIVCDNYAFAQSHYVNVSIPEEEKLDVSIVPNPATNKFMLHVNGFKDKFSIKIYNVNGKECFSGEIQSPETEISIEFLSEGFYFVNLQNQKILQTHKLIIQ
ncbi:MAG: T9SS type A sorting domain-containing protein [Bacteroidetes bacterium]|nr:T9SS type A sorting domain-containing protein [Bacteroidota bacterium]